jgi:UDP-N-acetylmuramate--alanine ligase
MSEIFYAGGTASRDISSADIIEGIREKGAQARFLPDRSALASVLIKEIYPGTVILLMGARDPSLENFARELWQSLQAHWQNNSAL